MPKNRSSSGRYYDWPGIIAHLRTIPGRWSLELDDVPRTTLSTVRSRRHPALHLEGVRVEAQLRNEYVSSIGQARGDLYLRLVQIS